MLEDQCSRYGWAELIQNVPNGDLGDPATANLKMLNQFDALTLDNVKCQTYCYCSGNMNSNIVPNKAAMIVANIDPANNPMYKTCFACHVRSNMINNNI
eukprot:3077773-Ditylum_brightwellii.AAC.1